MGIGVLEGNGNRYQTLGYETVKLRREFSIQKRLKVIHDSVREAIRKFTPEVVALENVFFGTNVKSLVKIGEARASVMLAAEESGIPVAEYPPARIKQSVSGNGRASKAQIQQMMRRLLGLKELPPVDAADALAVALCHLLSKNVRIPVR